MTDFTLRAWQPGDHLPVVALWNRCLTKDFISPERFWRLFLLDENFDPEGAIIAESDSGEVIGFLQTIYRKVPYSGAVTPEQGWLTVFFVDETWRRQGVGTALLARGREFLRAAGCKKMLTVGYSPYYIFPGVDDDYKEAHQFLKSQGLAPATDAVAMGMPLEGKSMPERVREKRDALAAEGIIIRDFQMTDTLPLFEFADTHFPGWTPSLRDSMTRGSLDIVVAVQGQEILAYAQWQNPHNDPPHGASGRFGPFGVRPDLRSQGIGAVVFYAMVERALAAGSRYLWFGWAGGRNLSFYERAGCRVTRHFQLYRTDL